MKAFHIIILAVVVVGIAVVVSLFRDSSTYSDFGIAAKNPDNEYHIIGSLVKGKPIEYNAAEDANSFSFYMTDEKGNESKVRYSDAKPQDFEKSEKVVIIGKMGEDEFSARKILLKCPSKYNEENVPAKFDEVEFNS